MTDTDLYPIDADRTTAYRPVPLGRILLASWPFILLVGLVFSALGVYTAFRGPVTFRASASLSVGTTNVSTPAQLGGFAASAPTLAGAYARAGAANEVVEPAARQLELPAEIVRSRVVTSQVPQTPVIRVDAQGPDGRQAVALANAVARRLVAYAGDLNRSNVQARTILARYRRAQRVLVRARSARADARRRAAGVQSPEREDALLAADSDVATAQLRTEVLGEAYRTAQISLGSANPLALLQDATSASSNRRSRAQLVGFTGLVGGLVVGAALSLAFGARRYRRGIR